MSFSPSNSAQTISFGGYTRLAHQTQLTGFLSYGVSSNDDPLQPFTMNSALAPNALPRATTDAEAHVLSTNLNLESHRHHRLAVRRTLPQLHLRQPHAGDEHHELRRLRFERVDDPHRRSGFIATTGPRSTRTRRGAR